MGCIRNCASALCSPKKPRYMHYHSKMPLSPLADLSQRQPPQPQARPQEQFPPPPGSRDLRCVPVYEELDNNSTLTRGATQQNVSRLSSPIWVCHSTTLYYTLPFFPKKFHEGNASYKFRWTRNSRSHCLNDNYTKPLPAIHINFSSAYMLTMSTLYLLYFPPLPFSYHLVVYLVPVCFFGFIII